MKQFGWVGRLKTAEHLMRGYTMNITPLL